MKSRDPDFLKGLPVELQYEIIDYLNLEQTNPVVLTCRGAYSLFQPNRLKAAVFYHVDRGHEEKVQEILTSYPRLFLEYGDHTDISGRRFIKTSLLQLALWKRDIFMCRAILMAVPRDDEEEKIRSGLLEQYDELKKHGVNYRFNGESYTEKHYNHVSYLDSLRFYIANYNTSSHENKMATNDYWINHVGAMQLMLPSNIAEHYCDPEQAFEPLPDFEKKPAGRNLSFYDNINKIQTNWFVRSYPFRMGRRDMKYACCRYDDMSLRLCFLANVRPPAWHVQIDLDALTNLFAIRKKQIKEFRHEITHPLVQDALTEQVKIAPSTKKSKNKRCLLS